MFGKLKDLMKKKEEVLGSPIEGEAVEMKEVNDPTFADEILGKGVAIKPSKGRVVAPCDGEVLMVFETKHAISIKTEKGAELLIHVGLDTVQLKGEHFTDKIKAGDKVKAGDILLEFDLEKIKQAGYDTICPIVVCNTSDFSGIQPITGAVTELTEVLKIMQ